jgi:AcrR family transcriptional regulator
MSTSDRSYPSVWARPRRKGRSPLTREQIVAEALRLLDAGGVEALSMRKLGARLEAGATSLYWHVANRDELIELVIDHVYGELDVPDVSDAGDVDDWQETTRRAARSLRSALLRHRWVVSAVDHLVAALPGPNQAQVSERMLGLFESAGFPLPEAERAVNTVAGYVTGVALAEAAFHNWLARHGVSQQDWFDEAMRVAEEATKGHARLQSILTGYEGKDPLKAMEEDFEYGLDRVLDGLQARLDAL